MTLRFGFGLLFSAAMLAAPATLAQTGGGAGSTGGVLLSEGTPVATQPESAERKNGEAYLKDKVTDWEVRCIYLEDRADPCQMYQLLNDETGTPTSEITLFKVGDEKFSAGARVITPLETALLSGVTFSIDGGLPSQYPFQVCNPNGCVAQIGLTEEQVAAMKRGQAANISIVPFRAQQTQVALAVSLAGFTGAFDLLGADAVE